MPVIDLCAAKQTFSSYLSDFNCSDPKIRLKICHTGRVMKACRYLSRTLNLTSEQTDLAMLIGLLHDIGRFRQLRLIGSFNDAILPHAQCSLDVLFGENKIRDFIEPSAYDSIIYDSIQNHGIFQIDRSLPPESMLYARLLRDADKLDNFYTKLTEDIPTMLDIKLPALQAEPLSNYAYQTFLSCRPLRNDLRETHLDMWISYIAYIFDLNFAGSFAYIRKKNYIPRLFARVSCTDPKTAQRISQLEETAQSYISSRCPL